MSFPLHLSPLIATLRRRDDLSSDEMALLNAMPLRPARYQSGSDIVAEGSRPRESCLVLSGFAARVQYLTEGQRQITAIHVPGDFVDLHGYLLKIMDHGVIALGPCEVAFVPHSTVKSVTEASHHLARLFWLLTTIDGAIQRTWITCLGRRSAEQHLAHILCEMYMRLEAAGEAENFGFEFPVTQSQLGDVLGLSTVHVNRKLQELRTEGLLTWQGTRVNILNFARLASFAEFDPLYLNLQKEPR